jgi:surfactin synthase thioesterase subunit
VRHPSLHTGGEWLQVWRTVPRPRLRLVCLPHAGGTAGFYRPWIDHTPPGVELVAMQYPGRQDRLDEACIEHMDLLADRATDAVAGLLDRPLALFGHSMGAAVAYEVTVRLEERYGRSPVRLFTSGRQAPHRERIEDVTHLDDDALVNEVRGLGELDGGILDDPDVREVLLPPLRADYRLISAYRPAQPVKVAASITTYTGLSDPGCPIEGARAWSELTTGRFDLRIFPGDHFFLVPAVAQILHDLFGRVA